MKWSGTLTKNFTLDEYAVHQNRDECELTQISYEHAQCLQDLRDYLKKPIKVNSWYRTKTYNNKLPGASKSSNHLKGCATDIAVTFETDEEFIAFAKKWKDICKKRGCVGEIGRYSTFTHVGSHITYSKTFYNWDKRSGKQINMFYKI